VLVAQLRAPASQAASLWTGNYETGNFAQWGSVQSMPGRATIVGDRVHEGRYAARYEVRPGDDPLGSGGERAEAMALTGETAGTESWWAWSTYFGDDFQPAPDTIWNIFTQWHHTGSTGQANAHFELDAETSPWHLQLRTFGGLLNQNERRFNLGDFRRNTWLDFVFHVRWAPDATGFVEVWVNGVNVVPLTNTPTLYAGQSVYVKQGFYRAPSAGTSVVYQDAMRRGTSYPDVVAPPAVVAAPPPAAPSGQSKKKPRSAATASHSLRFLPGRRLSRRVRPRQRPMTRLMARVGLHRP
jgi:hypothetical protein